MPANGELPTRVRVKREATESPPSTSAKRHSLIINNNTINTSTSSPSLVATTNAQLLRRTGFRHQRSIDELLEKRTDLKVVDATLQPPVLGPADLLGPDEEIWMFQCSRNVSMDSLLSAKLSLNGQRKTVRVTGVGAFEYQAEPATGVAGTRLQSMLCRTQGSRKHELVAFRAAGVVHVHDEIQETLVADIGQTKQTPVPYPSGLKVRHPLHGSDYDRLTSLDGDVERKLRSAVRTSRKAKVAQAEAVAAGVPIKQERIERVTVQKENGGTSSKKTGGKKRKAVESSTVDATEDAAPPKTKRIKKEKSSVKQETVDDAEPGADLDWLSAI